MMGPRRGAQAASGAVGPLRTSLPAESDPGKAQPRLGSAGAKTLVLGFPSFAQQHGSLAASRASISVHRVCGAGRSLTGREDAV